MHEIASLIESGRYKPVIDRICPGEDILAAAAYVETGQKTGNAALAVTGTTAH